METRDKKVNFLPSKVTLEKATTKLQQTKYLGDSTGVRVEFLFSFRLLDRKIISPGQ